MLIYSLEQLHIEIQQNPDQWRPLVFTNGCFDLLHAGHVRYLNTASQQGKRLIIGLNSDRSVQSIKPTPSHQPSRPLNPENQRAEVLCSLRCVSGVVIFEETTATHLIEVLQPDIYVKGGDYQIDTLPEAKSVYQYGGKIILIPFELPTSTSKLIEKILNSCS